MENVKVVASFSRAGCSEEALSCHLCGVVLPFKFSKWLHTEMYLHYKESPFPHLYYKLFLPSEELYIYFSQLFFFKFIALTEG